MRAMARQGRDHQTLEWAAAAMAEGRYEDAAAQYARAVARHPDDPDLSLQSGDAYYALSATKPEVLSKARVAWEAAAKIKPDNLPALTRLLKFHLDMAEIRPTPAEFDQLASIAHEISAITPSDSQACGSASDCSCGRLVLTESARTAITLREKNPRGLERLCPSASIRRKSPALLCSGQCQAGDRTAVRENQRIGSGCFGSG